MRLFSRLRIRMRFEIRSDLLFHGEGGEGKPQNRTNGQRNNALSRTARNGNTKETCLPLYRTKTRGPQKKALVQLAIFSTLFTIPLFSVGFFKNNLTTAC